MKFNPSTMQTRADVRAALLEQGYSYEAAKTHPVLGLYGNDGKLDAAKLDAFYSDTQGAIAPGDNGLDSESSGRAAKIAMQVGNAATATIGQNELVVANHQIVTRGEFEETRDDSLHPVARS